MNLSIELEVITLIVITSIEYLNTQKMIKRKGDINYEYRYLLQGWKGRIDKRTGF